MDNRWLQSRVYAAIVALFILTACGNAPTTSDPDTSAGAPASAPDAEIPGEASGTGEVLRILYWQAPTTLNPHLATGLKDADASRLILEPLAAIDPDGQPTPLLAADIPTIENGGIAEDLTSITWNLRRDITWSDGSDFTAADVVFTYTYCADEKTACTTAENFQGIASVDAIDDYTVTITWDEPNTDQYKTFTSIYGAILQKSQFENCVGEAASTDAACQEANLSPIGTGPYTLREFRPGDVAIYERNEFYRERNKPFFQEVQFKGGGDAPSAARAVFQTGDTDYAWNLQIEAAVLSQLANQGDLGESLAYNTSNVELLMINFTNPDSALNDERGQLSQPHPFLTDPAVRRALSLAIDRQVIAEQLYGPSGAATCEILGYEPFMSADEIYGGRRSCAQDLAEANQILDAAGWERGSDGIREKEGVRLSLLYQTSVNSVRQKTQELIKQWWQEIGIEVELKSVDASVFFDSAAGNPDNINHFFADIQMYTPIADRPDPTAYLCQWISSEVAQQENEWRGQNQMRWQNEEYDTLCTQLQAETDPQARTAIALQMNDLLIEEGTLIPLIARKRVLGHAGTLQGLNPTPWDSEMWNIADWSR